MFTSLTSYYSSVVLLGAMAEWAFAKPSHPAVGKHKSPNSLKMFLTKIRKPFWRDCSIFEEARVHFSEEYQYQRQNKRTKVVNRWGEFSGGS